jgi:hypothetical protein
MADSVTVGKFPVRDKWFVQCSVTYYKGRGYYFQADPVEDVGNGIISIRLSVLGGPGQLLQEAKRLSRPTFDRLAGQMRLACEAKSPAVVQLVAAATERIPQEMSHA